MKIQGIMPKKPITDPVNIAGIIAVGSLIAVGEYKKNTPILQINNNKMKGIILNNIDGTLMKCLLSSLGPHAQKHELKNKRIEKIPKVAKTVWKYPSSFFKNRYKDESKKGSIPEKFSMLKQGDPPEKQKNSKMKK